MTANKCVSEEEASTEIYVNFVADQSTPQAVTLERIQAETAHDKMLQALIALIHSQAEQTNFEAFLNILKEQVETSRPMWVARYQF